MYTMTVLTSSPFILLIPREESVRREVIWFMKRYGFSMNFDKKRDFVCVTKNTNVPAYILMQALAKARLDKVGFLVLLLP
jgi:hypothetical protein